MGRKIRGVHHQCWEGWERTPSRGAGFGAAAGFSWLSCERKFPRPSCVLEFLHLSPPCRDGSSPFESFFCVTRRK